MDLGQATSWNQVPSSMDSPVSCRDGNSDQPPPSYSTLPPEHPVPPSYYSLSEHSFGPPRYTEYQMDHPEPNQRSHGAFYPHVSCPIFQKPFSQCNFSSFDAHIKPSRRKALRDFQPKSLCGAYDIRPTGVVRLEIQPPEPHYYWKQTSKKKVTKSYEVNKLSLTGAVYLGWIVMWFCGCVFGFFAFKFAGNNQSMFVTINDPH